MTEYEKKCMGPDNFPMGVEDQRAIKDDAQLNPRYQPGGCKCDICSGRSSRDRAEHASLKVFTELTEYHIEHLRRAGISWQKIQHCLGSITERIVTKVLADVRRDDDRIAAQLLADYRERHKHDGE